MKGELIYFNKISKFKQHGKMKGENIMNHKKIRDKIKLMGLYNIIIVAEIVLSVYCIIMDASLVCVYIAVCLANAVVIESGVETGRSLKYYINCMKNNLDTYKKSDMIKLCKRYYIAFFLFLISIFIGELRISYSMMFNHSDLGIVSFILFVLIYFIQIAIIVKQFKMINAKIGGGLL